MTPIADVVVVGSGPVGAACARALAARGAKVTLLERPDPVGAAWRAAAGMLAAQVEAGPGDPLLGLAVAGRTFYREQAAELEEHTGIDIGLDECGIVEVAHDEGDVVVAKAKVAWQRQQSLRADWLSAEEVVEGWPWLEPGLGAFWAAEDGTVDPVRTVAALRKDAVRRGVTLVSDTARAVTSENGRVAGVQAEQSSYPADQVVIAAGAWSGRIGGLPRPLSVEPVRGQIAAFPWPRGARPVVAYGPRCYLLHRDGEMLVGATMEHAGFDSAVTPEAVAALVRRAATIYPALRDASVLRTSAGLRPGTPDGLPIIGREPRLPGLWYATGHGRNGVLLAGVTGDLLAQQIFDDVETTDVIAVRPERFWNW